MPTLAIRPSDRAARARPRPSRCPTAADRRRRRATTSTIDEVPDEQVVVFEARDVAVRYSGVVAVEGVSLDVFARRITALIGPSGCGKSTFLRTFNRMNDLIAGRAGVRAVSRSTGTTSTRADVDPIEVRRRIGMVFQKPNPFPKSIFDNVAFGPRINGRRKGLDEIVEQRAAPGRALGRGQGQAEEVGVRALGRSAAAALHRALPRGRARRDPDGRAVLGARPDRDVAHRRPHDRPEARVHDRDRHAQHAAGGARLRHDRVHDDRRRRRRPPHRPPGRVRRRPTRCSPTRPIPAPRVTSPAGSGEWRRSRCGDGWVGDDPAPRRRRRPAGRSRRCASRVASVARELRRVREATHAGDDVALVDAIAETTASRRPRRARRGRAALAAGRARRGDRRDRRRRPHRARDRAQRAGAALRRRAPRRSARAGRRRRAARTPRSTASRRSASSSSTVRRARCSSCARSRCAATARSSARSRSRATCRRPGGSRACAATSWPT